MYQRISLLVIAVLLLSPGITFAVSISPIQATVATSTPMGAQTTVTAPPQEASTDYLIKIPPIDGESTEGNVEYEWKVEKGEKSAMPSIEPDEIDVDDDSQPITPDFGILLGGDTDDEATKAETEHDRDVFVNEVKAADSAIESISFNYEKITTKVRHEVNLFGFIRVSTIADVVIDGDKKVSVLFPWWTVFATGKNSDSVGERTFTTLSTVLKTKHDTIKDSINTVR